MAQEYRDLHRRLNASLDVMLDATSRHALSGIIIDRLESRLLPETRLPLVGDSTSSGVKASITLFLPKRTPFRVWRWLTDFLERPTKRPWLYWKGLREIQASLIIDSCVLAKIGELFKKCCTAENRFTLQIAGWGIFYHNGDSFHFLRLKEGNWPVSFKTRWNKKRTGIIMCGLNLNGAQITAAIKDTSTTLRSSEPPSKGRGNLDELHVPIPIEELKGIEESFFHAAKVVEFDGISLVVRSAPSSLKSTVVPSKSSLKENLQDGLQKILPLVMKMTKTKQQLLVEYWKGVLQMEMIECRNKFIIQFQNLPASQSSTSNGVSHSLCFIPMCPSSRNREYWQRALHDLSEDDLSTRSGSSSQSSTVHSIGGRVKFLLGEFDRALLDFDRALLDSDCALNSNLDGLASTLFDRAMVKCLLARYPEATQDINRAAEINPNSSNIKRFRACLEDMILCTNSSKSSMPILQPTQPVFDLLTGDHDAFHYYEKKRVIERSWMLEFTEMTEPSKVLASIPDWTVVREPSKDLPELDLQRGASHNHKRYLQLLLLDYLKLCGLTGYDSLRTGEKLAEGGQAEIFEALGTPPLGTQTNLVLKVFKQVFTLQTWLQPDVLQFGGVCLDHPSPVLCTALGVKFLKDGQCAFVFPRHWGDLRRLIDQQGMLPSPFEFRSSVQIMLQIAEGMRSLHICNILHRDLKASNILVSGDNPDGEDFRCLVADFECSVGVMGTGFWRAPEILTQLNHQTSEPKALAWSKEADVYSFGLTCFEIITGDIPFKNLKASDWDVVVSGDRPWLPLFLDSKLRTLIELCWHVDPELRPNFSEICKVLADVKGVVGTIWSSRTKKIDVQIEPH